MLERIIDEVKRSIDNECFIAALALALTIPDICGKAEYPNSGVTDRYIKWFNTYIGAYEKPSDPYGTDMPYSSGELIYNLRNSMLHQGTPGLDASKVKEERCKVNEFVLTISNEFDSGVSCVSYGANNAIVNRMLEVNVVTLCSKLCAVAKVYYAENQNKFDFLQFELKDIRHAYDGLFIEVKASDK